MLSGQHVMQESYSRSEACQVSSATDTPKGKNLLRWQKARRLVIDNRKDDGLLI
jgi:hypothetical protein